MIRFAFRLHYIVLIAVIGSLLGSLLMFLIGGFNVIEAFLLFFRLSHPIMPGKESLEATAAVLEALDNFLLGFVLLYFAYSLYFLGTYPEERAKRLGEIKMPPALEVASLGEMKKTIMIIIVVSLSVFMWRELLISTEKFTYTDVIVPFSIIAVAVAIKLIDFSDS